VQLACILRRSLDQIPSTGDQMQNREHSYDCSAYVNKGLYDIGPDHRCQATLKCINKSEDSNDRDRCNLTGSQSNSYNNGHCINANAFSRSAGQQEQAGGKRPQPTPEAAFDQFIGGVKFTAEIMR